jgi:hypothetical protein
MIDVYQLANRFNLEDRHQLKEWRRNADGLMNILQVWLILIGPILKPHIKNCHASSRGYHRNR